MSEPNLATIGGRVAHLVALSGVDAYTLAALVGLSRPAVRNIIRDSAISTDTALRLTEATTAAAGWIIAGEGRAPGEKAVRARVTERQAEQAAKGAV